MDLRNVKSVKVLKKDSGWFPCLLGAVSQSYLRRCLPGLKVWYVTDVENKITMQQEKN